MPSVAQFKGNNSEILLSKYQDYLEREFFPGEVRFSDEKLMNLIIEKRVVLPVTVLHLRGCNRVAFIRSAEHVQAQKLDVLVVALVRRGQANFHYNDGQDVSTSSDEIVIYDSKQEVIAHLELDESGLHESFWAVIPSCLYGRLDWCQAHSPQSVSAREGPARLASTIITMMARGDCEISPTLSSAISEIFFQAAVEATIKTASLPLPLSRSQEHLLSIEKYVMRNFSSAAVSVKSAAAACGISERHVIYLLKAAGKTFSDLLWGQRLRQAMQWLASPRMVDRKIGDIAMMAGYKTVAHFSRSFKKANGCTPREYRRSALFDQGGAWSNELH